MEKVPRSVFTKEFKEEAVKMAIEGGLSQPEVCRRLSLAHSTLARWARQARKGGLSTSASKRTPVTEEEMELARLRREIAELKMERDILKNPRKGLAFSCDTRNLFGILSPGGEAECFLVLLAR